MRWWVVAELLIHSSLKLQAALIEYFNICLDQGKFDESWYKTLLRMLPKSRNLAVPSNWRLIDILPVLYKLFARINDNRLSPTLLSTQSVEQCAFTFRVRLEDALCTVEIAIGHCSEFNKPLWMLSVGMSKAFDSVEHEAVLYALIQHGVDPAYHMLRWLQHCINLSLHLLMRITNSQISVAIWFKYLLLRISVNILKTKISTSINQRIEIEFKNKNWQAVLVNKNISLKSLLKFFDACVIPQFDLASIACQSRRNWRISYVQCTQKAASECWVATCA